MKYIFRILFFLQGSNFATETFQVRSTEGRYISIAHDAGNMNRIDRVTASSFGMEINKKGIIYNRYEKRKRV